MQRLKINNFGPIKKGFAANDGYLDLPKFTVFIGEQGTGKSTVAKIISTFLWLEKALVRGDYDSFTSSDFRVLCKNQLLDECFKDSTNIEYEGEAYCFKYSEGKFSVSHNKKAKADYHRPKIIYVPSERNLLSIVEKFLDSQALPPMLVKFNDSYKLAKEMSDSGSFELPLRGYKVLYNKANMTTSVQSSSTRKSVPILKASSGLQSLVPLSIVTDFLSKSVSRMLAQVRSNPFYQKLILEKAQKENSQIEKELRQYFLTGIERNVSGSTNKFLETKCRHLINTCFVNIVEEPEQNLFPASQVAILEHLIKNANSNSHNELIVTTHSPYILSALNNYIYAAKLYKKKDDAENIVEQSLHVNFSDIAAYSIKNGEIKSIMDKKYNMIDTSEIDGCSSEINKVYDSLYDCEYYEGK